MIPVGTTPQVESASAPRRWQAGTLHYATGGLVLVFLWLLCGDFSLALRDRAIPPVMQLLFKRFNASDLVTGLIFSTLPTALGLLICPVVGFKSDRLRTRWGRRIPFLAMPIPLIVFSIFGLAFAPRLGSGLAQGLGGWSPGRNACVLLMLAVFWTLFEICCLVGNTVFGALVNDVVPQEVIGRFYGLFRAVSLIAGIIFFFKGLGSAETYSVQILLGIGALYGGGLTIMCLKVKEGRYPPVNRASARPGFVKGIRTYFKEAFGSSFYRWYFAAGLLGGLCSQPFNIYSLFYAGSIGMNADRYGKCVALTYTCSLFLSYPLGMLADRFHPLRVTMGALALYAVVMACGGIFAADARMFAIFFVAHGVVSGSLFTAWASNAQRLLSRAKFAEINSAAGIVSSVGAIIVVPLLGVFLDAVHHHYQYTFYISAVLAALALAAYARLHTRFMSLGGPVHYTAPE